MRIRAAAVASKSEAEWLGRIRDDGIVVRPYFAKGTTDVVVGYRAALKTGQKDAAGQREPLHFYGGGTINRDLSLPRLREMWPEPTVEAAGSASVAWQDAARGRPVAAGLSERPSPGNEHQAAARLAQLSDRLAQTPVGDRAAWSRAARDASGALAAWARYDPAHAAELTQAADTLARTAQDRRPGGARGQRSQVSAFGTANLLLAAAKAGNTKLAGAALMAQLINTAAAVRDYHRAAGDLKEAQRVHTDAVQALRAVNLNGPQPQKGRPQVDRPAPTVGAAKSIGQARPKAAAKEPLPSKLTRPPAGARNRKEPDRGPGR